MVLRHLAIKLDPRLVDPMVAVAKGEVPVTEENDRGLCFHVEYHDFDMVVCSDINGVNDGSRTDIESVVAPIIGDVEVVKVNHHGSSNSSNATYVNTLKPEVSVISVGKNCLIGAEGGIGISLGDDCIIEAGCYVTAGTLVTSPDGTVVKAKELSGHDGLLFRRNSQSGAIEAVARSGVSSWQGLNEDLHKN